MLQLSVYDTLMGHAARQPQVDALVLDDLTVSYADFCEQVSSFASWLIDNGLRPGQTAGVCIADECRHLICAMALLCLGTPQMSLGLHEVESNKRALTRKTDVTQLVVERPEGWMEGLRTIVAPEGYSVSVDRPPALFPSCTQDAVGLYHNTSGSTSIPKTFGMTLERLFKGAKRYADNPKERRALRTGSIEFDAHRLHRICALLAGNTCVFARDLNPSSIAALCAKAEVSLIHLNAYKLASLAQGATSECRLPSCTGILTGGSRIPGALRRRVKALLTDDLWVLYATSETGMISRANPDEHERFPEGVGFPAPDVTFEILGQSGEPVRPGGIGRIRVHKSTMARGYISEPGTVLHHQDGWFYPGDLISQQEGGPLVFHGRADDVMILNGINIFPSAIEDTLESHPDVREAIAYAVKSRIHGDIPVAAVVMHAQGRAGPVELLNYCRQSLGVRAPRQIRIVEAIPRNTGGKSLRRQMAET